MARQDLRLSDRDFWGMTPRMLSALIERKRVGEQQHDFRAGVLASILANVHRDSIKRPQPFAPDDFFPSLALPTREMDDEELFATMERMFGAAVQADE